MPGTYVSKNNQPRKKKIYKTLNFLKPENEDQVKISHLYCKNSPFL